MNAITRLPLPGHDELHDDYTRAINAAIEAGRDDLVQDLADSYDRDLAQLSA